MSPPGIQMWSVVRDKWCATCGVSSLLRNCWNVWEVTERKKTRRRPTKKQTPG